MNKVFLSGNLTRDVEVRHTQSGKTYARAGIAVNRPFSKDAVDFFNLVAWEKTADFLEKYFKKGSRAIIEGRIQTDSYEKGGIKHTTFDVVVDNVEFGDSKRQDGDRPSGNDSAPHREPQSPPRRSNRYDDFDGEPIDPTDTPF